ncbi:MAG: type II CAAX endopeptidase family protein [Chlamydiales bacterium]|nr:type II CAAX endopeptidase family protein [Chlamydiales bacterium]
MGNNLTPYDFMSTEEWLGLQQSMLIYSFFIAFIALFIAWKNLFFQVPPVQKNAPSLSFYRMLGAFLVYIIIQLLVIPLFLLGITIKGLISGEKMVTMSAFLVNWLHIAAIFLSMLVIIFYLNRPGKIILKQLFWKKGSFFKDVILPFLYGTLSVLIALPVVKFLGSSIALIVFHFFHYMEPEQLIVKVLKALIDTPLLFSLFAFAIIVLIPFIEEVLFRGFLQTYLNEKWGKKVSYLLSALVFAFFHFEYSLGIGNIEVLSSLFVIGLFLSHLKEKKGTLWAPIGLHASFNALSILALMLGFENVA